KDGRRDARVIVAEEGGQGGFSERRLAFAVRDLEQSVERGRRADFAENVDEFLAALLVRLAVVDDGQRAGERGEIACAEFEGVRADIVPGHGGDEFIRQTGDRAAFERVL